MFNKLNRVVFTSKSGFIRIRELNGEEKSKAQQRRQQLAASLEAKKRKQKKLNGTISDESGEFRLLFDEGSGMIAESIGVDSFFVPRQKNSEGGYIIYAQVTSREGKEETRDKRMWLRKSVHRFSLAIENLLGTYLEHTCEQSPLKDLIGACFSAELRPLTEEEKSQLDELESKSGLPKMAIFITC